MDNSKKTVYLHIGWEKTGTSSIQSFLGANSKKLQELGIYFPMEHQIYEHNHQKVQFSLGGNKEHYWLKDNQIYDKKQMISFIQNMIKDSPFNSFIFSHETFYSTNPELLRKTFKDCNVKVIAYIRRPDEWLISAFTQQVGFGSVIGSSLRDAVRIFLRKKIFQPCYYDYLKGFIDVFGKENISIRIYEKQKLIDHDVVSDFLDVLDIEFEYYKVKQTGAHNPSLNMDQLAFILLLGKYGKGMLTNNTIMQIGYIVKTCNDTTKNKKVVNYISPRIKKHIIDRYKSEITEISKLFFDGSEIFNPTINKEYSKYNGLAFKDISKFITLIKRNIEKISFANNQEKNYLITCLKQIYNDSEPLTSKVTRLTTSLQPKEKNEPFNNLTIKLTDNMQKPSTKVYNKLIDDNSSKVLIGIDISDLSQNKTKILLTTYEKLNRKDLLLYIFERRDKNLRFSAWNYIEKLKLEDSVIIDSYYYNTQTDNIRKKSDIWISKNYPIEKLTNDVFNDAIIKAKNGSKVVLDDSQRHVLFFTAFHPLKHEGNSVYMKIWLDYLIELDFSVHLVYYDLQGGVSELMHSQIQNLCYAYHIIPVDSKLVNKNSNGLNVSIDDWCGIEVVDTIQELCYKNDFETCIVNYTFFSAVFDALPSYTRKILLTHDNFANRNKKMIEQGYGESAWISLTQDGGKIACERADIIVAIQDKEAEYFKSLVPSNKKVITFSPIFKKQFLKLKKPGKILKIGYFGSSNWVNETNLAEFIMLWQKRKNLTEQSEIIVAGGVSENLHKFISKKHLKSDNIKLLGRVDNIKSFFEQCDIIINPERGGSGMKIKTVETMSFAKPILSTKSGMVGINTDNKFYLAEDIPELVNLIEEIINSRETIKWLRNSSIKIHNDIYTKNRNVLSKILVYEDINDIPENINKLVNDYQIQNFHKLLNQYDVRNKKVLEIGSDANLLSAQLLKHYGAKEVFAINQIDNFVKAELPEGIHFMPLDATKKYFEENSFDFVYGVAVLEHILDFESLCKTIAYVLKPNGAFYIHGGPIWGSNCGHHILSNLEDPANSKYSFNRNNPVPDWSHLVLKPEQMVSELLKQGLTESDAVHSSEIIYNTTGKYNGSASNKKHASEIIRVFKENFTCSIDALKVGNPPNDFYVKANESISEDDLRTIDFSIFGRQKKSIDNSLVSIIIPFYNVGNYIDEAISSAVNQTHKNLEIILIDDRSKDNSRKIAKEWEKKDSRIHIITHEKNKGLGPGRNTGFYHSSGDYIFFFDSDDIMTKDAVKICLNAVDKYNVDVVVGSCNQINEKRKIKDWDRDKDRGEKHQFGKKDGAYAYLASLGGVGNGYVPSRAWGTLIKRDVFKNSELTYPVGEHEDLPVTSFLYYYAKEIAYLKDIVITYRYRENSLSRTYWDAKKMKRYQKIWENISENIIRFNLSEDFRSKTANSHLGHLLWKVKESDCDPDALEQLAIVVNKISESIPKKDFPEWIITDIKQVMQIHTRSDDNQLFKKFITAFDIDSLIEHYHKKLGKQNDL